MGCSVMWYRRGEECNAGGQMLFRFGDTQSTYQQRDVTVESTDSGAGLPAFEPRSVWTSYLRALVSPSAKWAVTMKCTNVHQV